MARTITFSHADGRTTRFVQTNYTQVTKRLRLPIPDAKRFVLGVAYPADKVDGHGEFIRAAELEQRAWDYVRKHRQIGWFHADGTLGHAEVVESYIHRGPDWHTSDIDGNVQVIKSGDWVLGAIVDEAGWEAVVNGPADGWSIDGKAKRRTVPRNQIGKP